MMKTREGRALEHHDGPADNALRIAYRYRRGVWLCTL